MQLQNIEICHRHAGIKKALHLRVMNVHSYYRIHTKFFQLSSILNQPYESCNSWANTGHVVSFLFGPNITTVPQIRYYSGHPFAPGALGRRNQQQKFHQIVIYRRIQRLHNVHIFVAWRVQDPHSTLTNMVNRKEGTKCSSSAELVMHRPTVVLRCIAISLAKE